jgi:glutamate-1-semialdehyde 2,1-aminomutase
MTVFFGPDRVRSWDDAVAVDRDRFARFFQSALEGGVLLPPSPFEALFLMRAHRGIAGDAAGVLAAAIESAR